MQRQSAPEFVRYSENEWSEIKKRATAAWGVFSDDMAGLRDTLEQLGRSYASQSKDKGQRQRFVSKKQQAENFRRQMIESDLPSELQQRAAEVAGEIERFCQLQLSRTPLDGYLMSLLNVWADIGGDWWSRGLNIQEAQAFMSACAMPLVGERSASMTAIGKRLQRLVGRGVNVVITFKMPDGQVVQYPIPLRRTARGRRRQTKPD